MSYTTIVHQLAREIALLLTRGVYQRALLAGTSAWSGATLQGKAARYQSRYARSRNGLLARLHADERLVVREYRGAHGKRLVSVDLATEYVINHLHEEGPPPPATCTMHTDCKQHTALAMACAVQAEIDPGTLADPPCAKCGVAGHIASDHAWMKVADLAAKGFAV